MDMAHLITTFLAWDLAIAVVLSLVLGVIVVLQKMWDGVAGLVRRPISGVVVRVPAPRVAADDTVTAGPLAAA